MRDRPLVLLIDDEEAFLEIASVKLRSDGFDTAFAHNVSEALSKAEELLPDLMLSDVYMPPGPNGWQLALAVKSDPKLQKVKFAFFTSLRDPAMEMARSQEAQTFALLKEIPIFSKTDDVQNLDKRVRALL